MKLMKRIFLILLFILALFVLVMGSVTYYAFKIEPYQITLKEYDANEKKENRLHLKVIQISDIHIKEDFTYKNLATVVDMINEQNPDVVVFSGDLYDNYAIYNDDVKIILELQKINAKYAKIAIWGNRDYGGGAVRQYETIMNNAGFTVLRNEHKIVSFQEKNVLFTGLDDSLLGNMEMPASTETYNVDYKILLLHEPDAIEQYVNIPYDIALSGHSHGGQVNVPFMPMINEWATATTEQSINYNKGMYELNKNGIQKIFVNTGIGTTHLSIRFGVVPEVALFHMYI